MSLYYILLVKKVQICYSKAFVGSNIPLDAIPAISMLSDIFKETTRLILKGKSHFSRAFSAYKTPRLTGTLPALIVLSGLLLNVIFTVTPTTTEAVFGGPDDLVLFTTPDEAALAASDSALSTIEELDEPTDQTIYGYVDAVTLEFIGPFGTGTGIVTQNNVIQPASKTAASGPGGISRTKYLPTTSDGYDQNCAWPVKGTFMGASHKPHNAQDIAAVIGTSVSASCDGVVVHTQDGGYNGGYGTNIIIDHNGFKTRYAHLSKILVVEGQRVRLGEKIGEVGNTGRSTGPHLHFELWLE